MKKLAAILFIVFFACSSICFAQQSRPQRGTAEYYLANPERYLDKPLTIYILMAGRIDIPAPKGYVSFIAHTSSNTGKLQGGSILLYVKARKADKFAEKHNTGWLVNGRPQVTAVPGRFIKAVGSESYAVMAN